MKVKLLLAGIFATVATMAANPIVNNSAHHASSLKINKLVKSESWTEYTTFDGVKIEYKFMVCENETIKNETVVLFKYSNLTNESKKLSWNLEVYRDGECSNCHRIDHPEHAYSITLAPNQSIEGDGTSREIKELYLFSNFNRLVPGMTETYLTNFSFINLKSEVID